MIKTRITAWFILIVTVAVMAPLLIGFFESCMYGDVADMKASGSAILVGLLIIAGAAMLIQA